MKRKYNVISNNLQQCDCKQSQRMTSTIHGRANSTIALKTTRGVLTLGKKEDQRQLRNQALWRCREVLMKRPRWSLRRQKWKRCPKMRQRRSLPAKISSHSSIIAQGWSNALWAKNSTWWTISLQRMMEIKALIRTKRANWPRSLYSRNMNRLTGQSRVLIGHQFSLNFY